MDVNFNREFTHVTSTQINRISWCPKVYSCPVSASALSKAKPPIEAGTILSLESPGSPRSVWVSTPQVSYLEEAVGFLSVKHQEHSILL